MSTAALVRKHVILLPQIAIAVVLLIVAALPVAAAGAGVPVTGSSTFSYDEGIDGAPVRVGTPADLLSDVSAPLAVALATWEPLRPISRLVAPRPGVLVDAGKYDYLFGNVSSNSHNLSRSLQNQRQLNRIGVYDNAAGRDLLSSHFDEVLATDSNIVRTWTDEWGTHQIRESIFAGPNGVLKFESSWQVTSDGFRLETVIPFGGG